MFDESGDTDPAESGLEAGLPERMFRNTKMGALDLVLIPTEIRFFEVLFARPDCLLGGHERPAKRRFLLVPDKAASSYICKYLETKWVRSL